MYSVLSRRFFVRFPRTTRFSSQLIFRLTFRFNRYILSSSMLVYLHLYLYIFQCAGGDEESRTPDLLLARQAL